MKPTEHYGSPWEQQSGPFLSEEQIEHMIALLRSNRKPTLFTAIDILGINRCTGAILPLFALLVQRSGDHDIETRIKKALHCIGSPAVLPLLNALKTGDELVRRKAIRVLGHLGDTRAIAPVAQALTDKSEQVQYAAVLAISGFTPEAARLPLLAALHSESPLVRSAAAAKLSAAPFHDARVHMGLMEASADADPTVRRQVIKALGQHGKPCAIPRLLKAMQDEMPWVRVEAAEALGFLKEPGAIPRHLHALKDENSLVRESAAKALARFETKTAVVTALLGSASLTPAEKLNALEILSSLRYKFHESVLDYRFPSVSQYCRTLLETDLAPEVRQGIEAVQGEMQARQDRRQLLRGSPARLAHAKEELLRPHSGVSSKPPAEMLRSSAVPSEERTPKASWLTRLLGHRH